MLPFDRFKLSLFQSAKVKYTCIIFAYSYVMPSKFYFQNWGMLLVDGCFIKHQVGQHKFVCLFVCVAHLYKKYMCSS